jgi:hypothetical protein
VFRTTASLRVRGWIMSRRRLEGKIGGSTAPTVDAVGDASTVEKDLLQLSDLLERADIEGARALVQVLAAKWPASERVQHFARVLAPPVVSVRPGKPGHSRQRERAWLREHGREYAGCWLALLGDQLVAADPDPAVVLATLRGRPEEQDVLLHFEPGPAR